MKHVEANMNFVFASDNKKKEVMHLFTEYKHNASKWGLKKKSEAEEQLRFYGLIEF